MEVMERKQETRYLPTLAAVDAHTKQIVMPRLKDRSEIERATDFENARKPIDVELRQSRQMHVCRKEKKECKEEEAMLPSTPVRNEKDTQGTRNKSNISSLFRPFQVRFKQ